jgi:hypothetical protein
MFQENDRIRMCRASSAFPQSVGALGTVVRCSESKLLIDWDDIKVTLSAGSEFRLVDSLFRFANA